MPRPAAAPGRLAERVSRIVDKYRPIDATPQTTTRPWGVVAAALALVAVTGLWGSSDVHAWVSSRNELPAHELLLQASATWHGVAEWTGVAAARAWADSLVEPLQHTPRVLERPTPPPAPVQATVVVDTDAPADTDLPPGARWTSPAEPGGERVQRVVLVGASSMQYYLGVELERRLEADFPGVQVARLGKLGTGLARPDVFDWHAAVRDLVATHRPDVVVLQLGGNDAQPLTIDGARVAFGREAWGPEYSARLASLTEIITDGGAVPIFLGMPVMRDPGFSGRMERMNTITEAAVVEAGGRYLPTWDLVSEPDGSYRADVSHDGRRGRMRLQDGVHYSRLGAQFLADRLVTRLRREVPLVPEGDEALPHAFGHPTDPPHVAWIPREVPDEGLPAVVLHRPSDQAREPWLDALDPVARTLARDRRVVLVALDPPTELDLSEAGLPVTSTAEPRVVRDPTTLPSALSTDAPPAEDPHVTDTDVDD